MTPPVPRDQMRIGDREREAMTERLAKAHSLGQLTLDEFDERVTRTQGARTRGDLDTLDADLPRERGDSARRDFSREGRAALRDSHGRIRWARIALIAFAVWLVSRVVLGMMYMAGGPEHHRGYRGYDDGGIYFMSVIPMLIVAALAFLGVRRYRRTRQNAHRS